jgi:hypothetical protein
MATATNSSENCGVGDIAKGTTFFGVHGAPGPFEYELSYFFSLFRERYKTSANAAVTQVTLPCVK